MKSMKGCIVTTKITYNENKKKIFIAGNVNGHFFYIMPNATNRRI